MFVTQLGGNIIKTQFDGSGWTTYGSYYKNLSKYNGPWGIYYDAPSGFMYVADTLNNRIIKTKQDGTGWQTYGTSGNGVGQFNQLQGLAYDPDTGFIYVSDYNNNRVVRTKIDGTGWATLSIPGPQGLYYDTLNDNIYVSTYNANVIRSKIDGTNQATLAGFSHAGGVYYDAASEVVYVADTSDYSRLVRSKMDSTEWDVLGKYTGKITLDLGSTQDINRAVLQANNTEHYRIRYSTDNLNWSTFFRVNKNASSGLRTRDSGALSAVSARYIQISALDRYTSPSVSEVSIYNTSGAIISNGITPTADYAPSFGSLGLITDGIFATEGTAYNNATYAVQHMYSTSNGSGVGEFNYYGGGHIWYDANTDFVYTSDLGNGRVVKTKMDGTGWTALGGFYNPRGVYYDSTTNYLYIGDYNNHRIVKTQIDGTGWWASSTSPYAKEKVLYSAQSTDDSRLVYDVASRKLRFYLAYSNKAQFVETPTLSLTDGSWYTVKASFNKAAHTLSIDLNGVNQVTQTYDTDWGSLSYGTSFYIGARNGSTTDRWDGMIDDININIESVDTTAPTNPTTLNTHFYYDNTKAVSFTSDSWGNSGTPYITWSGATDADSGLKGYYVYLGTDNTAEPNSTSGLLTPNLGARYFKTHVGADGAEQNVTVPANVLTTGVTYYLVLRTQDNDLNTTNKTTLFTYKYDGGAPAPPEFINASPAGCSTSSTFTFTWDAITDPVSGIAGYEYKNGSTGTIQQIADVSTLEKSPYQEGDNIIYIRTKDNAGNVSSWQTAVYCSTGIAYIIDGPTVVAGPSSIIVDWVSNKTTTSNVQVYEGNTYISEQGHTSYDITHNVKVVGLEPEKTYRYRLVWTDSSGNLGESEWYETATSKEPTVSNVKIDVVSPTRAIITWDTSEEAKAQLFYGAETAGTDTYAKSFIQNLDGLSGGTTYSVKIKSQNRDSYNFYSDAYSFSTPPIPIIGNLRFEPITDQSSAGVKVTWTTNVDTTSSVFVGPSSGALTEKSLSAPVKDHSISILDLQDNTNYSIYATGIDQYGNSAKSDTSTFKTSLDSRPPKIADLAIEATSTGTGTDAKAQIAVSFKTDESATAQVEYGEGSSSESYTSKTQEDTSYSTNHVVIIGNLDPSKIYHLRAVSRDRAGNTTNSEDNAVITKKPSESAFNLIMQSLTKAFSWLKIFN